MSYFLPRRRNMSLHYPRKQVTAIEFAADGSRFATVDDSNRIDVWDRQDRRVLVSVQHTHSVRDAALSPTGRWLAATGTDGYTSAWDVASSERIFNHKLVTWGIAVEFSPDGKRMALAGNVPEILIIETDSWSVTHRLRSLIDVQCIAFHPNGRFVASAHTDLSIRVWNLGTGKLAYTLEGHDPGAIASLAYHPSGNTLVSSGNDNVIHFWDLSTQRHLGIEPLLTMAVARQMVFSPEGGIMLSLTQKNERTYALRTLRTEFLMNGDSAPQADTAQR